MSVLKRYSHSFRNGNQDEMYRAWEQLDKILDVINTRVGGTDSKFLDDPKNQSQGSVAIPTAALLDVEGIDGRFAVTIVNPQLFNPQSVLIMQTRIFKGLNAAKAQIFHNLQSATGEAFDASSNVTDYGVSTQLAYVFTNPGATLFWRLRSSFDGVNWNPWQIFSSALTCGPIGVASGLMRSSSIYGNAVFNSTNFATVDSIDGGGTATIRVYGTGGVGSSWSQVIGSTTLGPFPAATLPGFLYATAYYVTWTGSVYLVSQNLSDILVDTYHFAGQLTTVNAGGGGGQGGGGGMHGGGGGRPK